MPSKTPDTVEKTIYFVRHGQSTENVLPVFQSPESPLNDVGLEQARRIAERVSKLSFETLIVSPFRRAKETADAIARATGKQPEYSSLFTERIKPTTINGVAHSDEKASEVWKKWDDSLYTSGMRVEDGENFDGLVARADAALAFLSRRIEKTLVVVTHGFFLRVTVSRVLLGNLLSGDILRRFQQATATENTGLTVLRYQRAMDGNLVWRLWIYNDHAHLG